jgi:hypothetical protein
MNELNENKKVGLNLPPWLLHVCIRQYPDPGAGKRLWLGIWESHPVIDP